MISDYLTKRKQEREQATSTFFEAQGHFRAKDNSAAYKCLENLLEKHPHTYEAFFAQRWLADKS